MKRTFFFFALGLFCTQMLQAAEFCKTYELEHPAIKERGRIMHFPDGRTFTLLGHVHGDRQTQKRFGNWARTSNDELSNEEWTSRITKFTGSNAKTLEHARQDLAFLRASLWQAQEPLFVAVEAQDDHMAGHVQNAMELRSALVQASCRREIDNPRFIRDTELVYMGGPLYSFLYDSELKDKYKLLGMENTEEGVRLQKQGKKKMKNGEARLAHLTAKQDVDEEKIKKVSASLVDEMNKQYDDVANILAYDQESIRRSLLFRYKDLDEKLRGALLTYLYGYLDYLRGMKKRDIFFTRKLGQQKRSGIFFFGQEHLESVSRLLELECKYGSVDKPAAEAEPSKTEIDEM